MNPAEYTRMYEVEDRHWWYVGLHELILNTVRHESLRLGRPLDIFDAGCGTGRLCQLLQQQGHRVTGCDASQEAIRLCRQRGISGVYQADLNHVELEPETFDVITSIDVLYHAGISDDISVMRRLKRGLRPGGTLIVNLVAHEYLRSTHDIAVHTRERYTRSILRQRLQAAGFDNVSITYRVSLLFPLVALFRLASKWGAHHHANLEEVASDVSLPPPLLNRLLTGVLRTENRLLAHFPLPCGLSVFCTAHAAGEEKHGTSA